MDIGSPGMLELSVPGSSLMDDLSRALLLLILCLVIHLVEEILTGFRKRLPIGEMPLPVFVGINIVIYTYCALTLALAVLAHPLAIPLAWILVVAMILNGIAHITMMALRRGYFPGGVTAFFLLAAAISVIHRLSAAAG